MKSLKNIFIILIFTTLTKQILTKDGNWLIRQQVPKSYSTLLRSVTSTPAIGIIEDENDSGYVTAQEFITDRTTKTMFPEHVQSLFKQGNISVVRGKTDDYKNYPDGSDLFPKHKSLATKFEALIDLMKSEPKFKAFFNKIHINVLNGIYKHLMNIYTNFNLQHVGIREVQVKDSKTVLQVNIPTFLQNEKRTAANKKTLIINHLVNLIESQFNEKIRSLMPIVPNLFATSAGKMLIQNDFSVDLTHLILKQLEPMMKDYKKLYLKGMGTYLSFFQEFCSSIDQNIGDFEVGETELLGIIESINQFLYGPEDSSTLRDPMSRQKALLSKMDPPMFPFSFDDIRALKLIPALARAIPENSTKIKWPEHIVEAANKGIFIGGHPLAYFTNSSGTVVTEESAEHLYIVIQSGKGLFQEELLVQPDWLNNWIGISKIIKGCLGDFSAIKDLGILDPCTELLIENIEETMNGGDPNINNPKILPCEELIRPKKIKHYEKPKQTKESDNIGAAIGSISNKSQKNKFNPSPGYLPISTSNISAALTE